MLAGAAAGLAVGTKGTALLALPGLAVVFVALFWRRLDRGVLLGTLLGGMAAVLLGSYMYAQNWLLYGAPTVPAFRLETAFAEITWRGFVANLARTLFQFAFADLSGPLVDPLARPLTDPLVQVLGAAGRWLFATLGIPTVVAELDIPWWPRFWLPPIPRASETFSGVGVSGGLMLAAAAAALIWPGRGQPGRLLLGFVAVSYVVLLAATLRWNPFAGGRFLLTACAVAAPLLGALLRNAERRMKNDERGRHSAFRTALALVLALWSGATGLYLARFNEDKPISDAPGLDRIGLLSLNPWLSDHQELFREIDQELGPASTAGVYGALDPRFPRKWQWEYPFFGSRFNRTMVPLVGPDYAERVGLRRPLPWSNESLVAAHRPTYVVLESEEPGAAVLPAILPNRCFELPLEYAKPALPWELWRCRDEDPRSVLENGAFGAWPEPRRERPGVQLPTGWAAELAGEGRLEAVPVEPEPGGEPFQLRLEYRADGPAGEGGIVQDVAVGGVRGRTLVVDARVRADRLGAAVLWVDDGKAVSEVANATTAAETLRLAHPVDPRATGLSVHLDASGAGADASVLVRTVLAIPRGP